jgi:uncharacterized protein YdhG (YjbR/CyaY superfamily)
MNMGASAASTEIDAILARLPDAERAALQSLREAIAAAAPEAEEAISYSLPAFRYKGRPLVSYAAAARHLSFFVMSGTTLEAHEAELAAFSTSKGTIRFTPDKPIPKALVETLVRERMAEIDAARTR